MSFWGEFPAKSSRPYIQLRSTGLSTVVHAGWGGACSTHPSATLTLHGMQPTSACPRVKPVMVAAHEIFFPPSCVQMSHRERFLGSRRLPRNGKTRSGPYYIMYFTRHSKKHISCVCLLVGNVFVLS